MNYFNIPLYHISNNMSMGWQIYPINPKKIKFLMYELAYN